MISSLKLSHRAIAANVPPSNHRMCEFQSLGGNCEFGFIQRRTACESSGLLRFTYSPIEELIHALSTNFREFGAPGDLELGVTPHNAYYAVSRRYGFWSNLVHHVGEADPETLLADAYSKTAHLKEKLLQELCDGSRIFVRKLVFDETQEQFERLVAAIRRFGKATILHVKEAGHPEVADNDYVPASVRWVAPGVMEGTVRRFSSMDRAWDIDHEPWIWLTDLAYALHHNLPAEALYAPPRSREGRFSPRLRQLGYQDNPGGISSAMRAVKPTAFDPAKVYLFQTWVWVPQDFTGENIFALVGQDHLQCIDADLRQRECWQRVWRAGRFLHNGDATAPVGVAMMANPNDTIWTYGAQMYEGVFPRYVPTPPFRPSRLRLLAKW